MNLKYLTDQALLLDTKHLAKTEREISLKVLHHLREIERRRLFSELGYGSLFEYTIKELGYSEPSAMRRIQSARLLVEMPQLEAKIQSGLLTFTNMALAAQLFKNENIQDLNEKKEIMEKIEKTTKKECERELLNYVTGPKVPKEIIKPVTQDLTMIKMNFSNETLRLFEELKNLMSHLRLSYDEMMRKVFLIAIDDYKKRKFKLNAKFTTPVESPCEKRYIPSMVKKEVYLRDKGRCIKCKSTFKLEYDHIVPYSQGGKSLGKNLRLLCFSCNQRRNKV